jgi:hypothetical protein
MSYKHTLLAGTSALAMIIGASAPAAAQPVGNFVFGASSATVSATVAQSVGSAATISALSSQVNNNLGLSAVVEANQAVTATGATVTGGPSASSSNLMSATAIANQFSNATGNTYVVDPTFAPAGGNATLGTSQLNYNSNFTDGTARLGLLGGVVTSTSTITITPAVSESTGTFTLVSGSSRTILFDVDFSETILTVSSGQTLTGTELVAGDTFVFNPANSTLVGTSGFYSGQTLTNFTGTPVVSGSTATRDRFATAASVSGEGAQAGAILFSEQSAPYTPSAPAVTSTSTVTSTVGGTGNAVTFTADAAYGAPVSLNNNTFAARVNGNLALSSVAGGVPTGGFSTGTASVVATDVSDVLAPVGTSIIVNAPVSLSNVQQNITDNASTTRLTGSTANTVVSALFRGTTPGFNGGPVTVSGNAVTAAAAGNSATVGLDLTAANIPTLGAGVAVVSAQGNNASAIAGEGSILTVEALNNNTTLRIMAQDSTGTLTQISNSTATLANNTVSSRTALNEITAQSLNTAATLAAGGSSGTGSASQLLSPTSTLTTTTPSSSTASVSIAGDYLNIAGQNNIGNPAGFTAYGADSSVIGTATVDNAVLGFFGGVTNGNVTVQGNAISGMAQGNVAALSTVMPLVSAAATSLTGLMQSNADVYLDATVSGTQIRITDSSALLFGGVQEMNVSSAAGSTVATASGGTSTFTSAVLSIGSADSVALGNTVRSTVFGNNGTASANLGQTTSGLTNQQVTTLASTGYSNSTPTGTQIESAAPTSVTVVQQNLGLLATANVAHPTSASGNGLFQIDAYQGLTDGTATIGNNALRSTAVGNFGEAAATVYGATGNTLAGGVAVGTFQGNADSLVGAFLGSNLTNDVSTSTTTMSGPVAAIGAGSLTNSTARVVNNTFSAVAVANSATGALTIPTGNILGGTVGVASPQYTNATNASGTLSGSYVVGNTQANAGTAVVASNLDQTTFDAALASSGSTATAGLPFLELARGMGSAGSLSSHLNVGASGFTNSNALVTGNTVSTTGVGNEYAATVSGFVTGAGTGSGSTSSYTALSLGSTQLNEAGSAGANSTVTSVNLGNGFIVSTASSNAAATGGISDNTGGTAVNSVLNVVGNTASAAATGNTARLAVTGIGTSGSGANTFVGDVSAIDGGNQASTAPVAITNRQSNAYSATTTSAETFTPAILASSVMQDFGVNFGNTSSTTGSTLQVNTNAMTATATANTADLSATLATGPAFVGGVGLNNAQSNIGAINTFGSASTTSNTAIQAVVGLGFFNVGTGVGEFSSSSSTSAISTGAIGYVENSTISVTGNRMVATATQNAATLSVTAPSTALVQGAGTISSTTSAGVGNTSADAAANIAAVNVQSVQGMDSRAVAGLGDFRATADAINSTVAVNSNVIGSIARGNTAETTLDVPRIDGTMVANNAQLASNGDISAATVGISLGALTNGPGATTENTPVSVSSNLVSAASTVNNYAATMSGLGQSGAGNVTQANATVAVTGASLATMTHTAGDLRLGSSQLISGGVSDAATSGVQIGIGLANLTTASSPLSVNSNTVSATANGNVSAQAILANGAGTADSRGGMGNYSAQGFGDAGSVATNSAVLGTVGGVNIQVTVAGESAALGAGLAGTMTASPVSVSGNSVTASATANSATLSTAFNGALRSTGSGSVSTATEANNGLSTTVTADYSLASVQSMSGSGTFPDPSIPTTTTRAIADVSGVNISTTLTNSATTSSPLNISNNTVTASANGNVSALSMIGNVSGAAGLGGTAVSSSQVMEGSLVSATNTGTAIGAQMVGGASNPTGSYMLTNAPVTINGNSVGTSAMGNSASLNSGFASATRFNGSGAAGTASTAAASGSNAFGDYVLLNTQRANNSQVAASTMGTTMSFAGAATNGPVNLQNNTVFATAFGNSATMAMSGAQAGGSIQSTNYQQTSNTTVRAQIVGTNIAASMASQASLNAPINVTGNAIRAVAVGNSVTNAVGR